MSPSQRPGIYEQIERRFDFPARLKRQGKFLTMMTRQERAKQFAPFDAMKGLQEALRDREERHSRVERHDISEEDMERNSEVISKLVKGVCIETDCYSAFHDVTKRGRVTEISTVFRYLRLNGEKIFFDDIYSIRITDYDRQT